MQKKTAGLYHMMFCVYCYKSSKVELKCIQFFGGALLSIFSSSFPIWRRRIAV